MPLAPRLHERRYRRRTAAARVMTAEEHVERVGGLPEIEEIVACSLCDETRVQPLFVARSR